MQELLPKILYLAVAVAVGYAADRLASRVLREGLKLSKLPAATIFVNIVRAVIWSFVLLEVSQPVLGIEPTGIVTALGVGSVVISLGLQGTISNIIGGLTLTGAQVIEPGDIVEVSGTRGMVTDITWRHTVVRNAAGSEIVIPNSQLNSSQITRLSDAAAHKASAEVAVRPDADPSTVRAEILATVAEALAENGLGWSNAAEFGAEPAVLFSGETAYGFSATIVFYVDDFTKAASAASDVLTKLAGKPWLANSL